MKLQRFMNNDYNILHIGDAEFLFCGEQVIFIRFDNIELLNLNYYELTTQITDFLVTNESVILPANAFSLAIDAVLQNDKESFYKIVNENKISQKDLI